MSGAIMRTIIPTLKVSKLHCKKKKRMNHSKKKMANPRKKII